MIVLNKFKLLTIVILLVLVPFGAGAADYIELWPEGWSEISPLFTTSIFADRFFVVQDDKGTSFLSVDGTYFKELDLTYRSMVGGEIQAEIVVSTKKELDNPFLALDSEGNRHILWLDRTSEVNRLNYTVIQEPYQGHDTITFWETKNTLQDLAAYQEEQVTHVVWTERGTYFQVYYGKLEDGKLVQREQITNSLDLSVRPSVLVDSAGIPHVAWMETSDFGVEIHYSKREKPGWSKPVKIGEGSVQDIQQAGRITLTESDGNLVMVWSALPRNRSQLYLFAAEVPPSGDPSPPVVLALGSRAKFVAGSAEPQLVWQGRGRFGAEVNHGNYQAGRLTNITNLTVGRKAAFRPEAVVQDDFLYVYWLQTHPERGYMVYSINNQYPKPISFWRKVGIDESAPLVHLFFLSISSIMLALVYTIASSGVLVVAGLVYAFLQRFSQYRNQSLFYQVALIATLLMAASHLPFPKATPAFFGLIHYGLSFLLAIAGTYLILRDVKQRGAFTAVAIFFIWMMLFQFFALLPQNILQ